MCRALPKARVLYCSATGVTDVKNMAFMERMGLWGESSAFKSYEAFLEIIQKKGLGKSVLFPFYSKSLVVATKKQKRFPFLFSCYTFFIFESLVVL